MIYVFEDQQALDLEPLTLTRATFELRWGAFTHLERIQRAVDEEQITLLVRPEMADVVRERFPDLTVNPDRVEVGVWINGIVPLEEDVYIAIREPGARLVHEGRLLGGQFDDKCGNDIYQNLLSGKPLEVTTNAAFTPRILPYLWDHFLSNGDQVTADFSTYFAGSSTRTMPRGVQHIGDEGIFLGRGITMEPYVLLDSRRGPIMIEDDCEIGAFSVIEGPCYIGRECIVWPHSHISDVSFGPVTRIMGQVERTIIQGYTNKQHYGFLGGAYLGSWINLGAGTTNSNLKNNYGTVRVNVNGREIDTGNRFIGLFMGDHTKTAIGTLLNTGTNVGVAANVFGDYSPPKYIPSFAWGNTGQRYDLDKLLDTMAIVKQRRDQTLTDAERALFKLRYEDGQ